MISPFEVHHNPTDNPHVWQISLVSKQHAMFNHRGYVYADETGTFSWEIYPTEGAALIALMEYEDHLNANHEDTF